MIAKEPPPDLPVLSMENPRNQKGITMISDVLCQALEDIAAYQRDFPKAYDDIREDIDEVRTAMRRLVTKLDNPLGFPDKRELQRN